MPFDISVDKVEEILRNEGGEAFDTLKESTKRISWLLDGRKPLFLAYDPRNDKVIYQTRDFREAVLTVAVGTVLGIVSHEMRNLHPLAAAISLKLSDNALCMSFPRPERKVQSVLKFTEASDSANPSLNCVRDGEVFGILISVTQKSGAFNNPKMASSGSDLFRVGFGNEPASSATVLEKLEGKMMADRFVNLLAVYILAVMTEIMKGTPAQAFDDLIRVNGERALYSYGNPDFSGFADDADATAKMKAIAEYVVSEVALEQARKVAESFVA